MTAGRAHIRGPCRVPGDAWGSEKEVLLPATLPESPTDPLHGAPRYKGGCGLSLDQKLLWKTGQEGGAEARRGDGYSQPLWARGAQGA